MKINFLDFDDSIERNAYFWNLSQQGTGSALEFRRAEESGDSKKAKRHPLTNTVLDFKWPSGAPGGAPLATL